MKFGKGNEKEIKVHFHLRFPNRINLIPSMEVSWMNCYFALELYFLFFEMRIVYNDNGLPF